MTDSEILKLILDKVISLETKVDNLETKVDNLETKVSGIELHLENVTDKNISIIAENHISLNNKLDEAIKGAGKDVMTRIEVNVLSEKVKTLEKEIAELKNKIA